MAFLRPPAPANLLKDWSSLYPELLSAIAEKVVHSVDYVRFRSVCSAWRRAAPRRKFPPLIMYPFEPKNGTIAFFDPASGAVHCEPVPEAWGTCFCGSSHGWILLRYGISGFFLLNPFSGVRVQLPCAGNKLSKESGGQVFLMEDEAFYEYLRGGFRSIDWPEMGTMSIDKAVLSAAPDAGGDCVVLAILIASSKVAFCRPGDEQWTLVDTKLSDCIRTAAYCHGGFYIADWKNVVFIDVRGEVPLRSNVIPLPSAGSFWKSQLLEYYGELLLVDPEKQIDYVGSLDEEEEEGDFALENEGVGERDHVKIKRRKSYIIYMLGSNGWLPVTDLGSNTLFFSTFYISAIIGNNFFGCNSNSIYLSSVNPKLPHLRDSPIHHYGVIYLENNVAEDLQTGWVTRISDTISWFTPRLQ